MTYRVEFTPLFEKKLRRYQSMRQHIQRHVNQVSADPYQDTERLVLQPHLSLRGAKRRSNLVSQRRIASQERDSSLPSVAQNDISTEVRL